jgi:hypothetical protein
MNRENSDFVTLLRKSVGYPSENPVAVALGKLGGKKGGQARRDKLSPERRKEIAEKAARARWNQLQ